VFVGFWFDVALLFGALQLVSALIFLSAHELLFARWCDPPNRGRLIS
jgi:hypothetical protein